MQSIDVSFTPELIPEEKLARSSVVVVDILRATSSWITALYHGAESIKPFNSPEECLAMKEKGWLVGAERGGEKLAGFDLGNSPFEYMENRIRGRNIALTTTNGTNALLRSVGAKEILLGSFLNIGTVIEYMKTAGNIVVVCSGWEGQPGMEDVIFAGALVHGLRDRQPVMTDTAKMAHRLYLRNPAKPISLVRKSSHVRRLMSLGLHADIDFCFRENIYTILGIAKNGIIRKSKL